MPNAATTQIATRKHALSKLMVNSSVVVAVRIANVISSALSSVTPCQATTAPARVTSVPV